MYTYILYYDIGYKALYSCAVLFVYFVIYVNHDPISTYSLSLISIGGSFNWVNKTFYFDLYNTFNWISYRANYQIICVQEDV